MNLKPLRVFRFVLGLAVLSVVSAASFLPGLSRAQGYQPKPSTPAPDLPASLRLSPRENIHPSAGLFGNLCQFEPIKNDMAFFGDQAVGGVRFARLPKDTKFEVEFLVRTVSEAKFELRASNGNGAFVRTLFTGPKGANRIFVNGKATKEEGGFASLRCFVKDANWSLVSAIIRPK